MKNDSKALLLRIFVSSTDKYKGKLLYETLVLKAKSQGLAGATVIKGIMGYGSSSVIHSYRFWEVTEKLPNVVEIIDQEHKVITYYNSIKEILENMKYGCLVTTEKVDVLMYKSGKKQKNN